MNDGSIVPTRPKSKGQMLDAQLASPTAYRKPTKQRQLEVLITEEELLVWDMLADGRTQKQVAKEMGIARQTVGKRINTALVKTREWMGREAEDWRNAQLLIIGKQISGTIDDTQTKPEPVFDQDGEQLYRSGAPVWNPTFSQAAKIRNMARVTLAKFLDHQAKLLNLTVERKEVLVDQRIIIGQYNLGEFEGAASMDDL